MGHVGKDAHVNVGAGGAQEVEVLVELTVLVGGVVGAKAAQELSSRLFTSISRCRELYKRRPKKEY